MDQTIEQWLREGLEHHKAGRLSEAEQRYRQVLEGGAQHSDAMHLLGVLRAQQKRWGEAETLIRAAIAAHADTAGYYHSLGNVQVQQERWGEAIESYETAVRLKPEMQNVRNVLAGTRLRYGQDLARQARLAEAAIQFELAANEDPRNAGALNELGLTLKDQGLVDDAVGALERALSVSLDPAIHSNLLLTLHYCEKINSDALARRHVEWAQQHAAEVPRSNSRRQRQHDRLRIGYVSADLRRHPVAYFIEPILEAHDRNKFCAICYANVQLEDEVSRRLAGWVELWRNVAGLDDAALAAQIVADEIDVLVDLSGHTAGNRLLTFVRKPAPVQVSYLGYPDTTGLTTIDYRLTDSIADPSGDADARNVEKLFRLEQCAWCYRESRDAPEVSELPAKSNGYVTFGSFNHIAKICDGTVALWAAVLRRVQNARLLLKGFGLADESTRRRMRGRFEGFGVDDERIEMVGPVVSEREHLAAYAKIDIALDTFPYNGTTTTCEALWMGAAVITRAGRTHVSRAGASLLTAAGFEGWVANSEEEFVVTAVNLATNVEALGELRGRMRTQLRESRLMDGERFTGALERAYEDFWRRYVR